MKMKMKNISLKRLLSPPIIKATKRAEDNMKSTNDYYLYEMYVPSG